MSRIAAPLGEVTMPMRLRKFWQRPFARRIEQAFRFQFSLERFELRLEQSGAARLQIWTLS